MTNTFTDQNGDIFKVYDTVGLNRPGIIQEFEDNDGGEFFNYELYEGHTTQEVIQHHRRSVQAQPNIFLNLFLVVDRENIAEEGLLMVNLEPYHGYVDGVREDYGQAGNAIMSLSIFNTDWWEARGHDQSSAKTSLVPNRWFAVYNMLPADARKSFESALFLMNDGLGDASFDDDDEQLAHGDQGADQPKTSPQRDYHVPVEAGGKDLDRIVADHARYAESHGLDPVYFAVIDDTDWAEKGVAFVRVASDGVDRFRRRGRTAGEMLNWIFIGLMTWDEAKNWDGRSIVPLDYDTSRLAI